MTQNRYYSSDALPTTLYASLSSSSTTVQVVSDSGMPTSYPFTLLAEWGTSNAEVITVTQAPSSGSGYFEFDNCLRGQDGTTAIAHSSGASVVHGVSARDYNEPQVHIANQAIHFDLVPTAVKTGAYNAVAGDFVLCNASSAYTVTLPTAPADQTKIAVKMVAQTGTNAITIASGGSDVFNVTAGSTTLTLLRLFQTVVLQYEATGAIWLVISTDPAISLDTTATDIVGYGTQGAGSTGKAADAGHTHYTENWLPGDNGYLASNVPLFACTGTAIVVAANLYLLKIPVRYNFTATNLTVRCTTGATGTSSGSYCGLWNASGTLLSGSSDIGSAFTTSGVKAMALTTPQALTPSGTGGFVWAGFVFNGFSPMPTLQGTNSPGSFGVNMVNTNLATTALAACINGTSVSSLASITPSSNSAGGNATAYWIAIS